MQLYRLRYIVVCILLVRVVYGQEPISLNYFNPEKYIIDTISVTGGDGINASALISLSGLRKGDQIKIPGPRIAQAIKNIWRQGVIDNLDVQAIAITKGKVQLILKVSALPRLSTMRFLGVKSSDKKEISDKLKTYRGRILTNATLQNAKNAVYQYYHEKGFLNAQVKLFTPKDRALSQGQLRISVKRGKKVRINSIQFLGQTTFSQATLQSQFENIGGRLCFTLPKRLVIDLFSAFLHPWRTLRALHSPLPSNQRSRIISDYLHKNMQINVFNGRKFDDQKYQDGQKNLITFLQSKGYRNAYIKEDTVHFRGTDIDIGLDLALGSKHYIGNIKWVGNQVYDTELLSKVLGVSAGDVYDPQLLERRLSYDPQGQDVSALYLDNGYLFFNAQPIEIGVRGTFIDIEMRMHEGTQARISNVIIKGNTRTKEHVIRRELQTLPGDLFRRSDVIRSLQRLGQLPFIDPEQTKPVPIPDPKTQQVNIEWEIAEKAGDQIELSAGWGGNVGFVGSLGFVLNNFALQDALDLSHWRPLPIGRGQQLSVRYRSNGRAFSSTSVSFTEPWLGGKLRQNLTVGYNYSQESYFSGNDNIGHFGLHGGNIGLTRSLQWPDDYFSLGYYADYRGYDLNNAANRGLGFDTGKSNSLSFALVLVRNSLDNPLYPRSGSYLSFRADFTPPYTLFSDKNLHEAASAEKYRWVEFHKWVFDTKTYIEFVKNLVLEARIHVGVLGRYSQEGVYTPFERFVLGGDGLGGQNFILGTDVIGLRGYPNNSIAPLEPSSNIQGGLYFTKTVFELRYLFLQTPAGTIYGSTFLEGGNSWIDFKSVSFYDLYRSVGVGLRLNIPAIGIVGIDWGLPMDDLPNVLRNGRFHFTIGTSFR